jgi:hypothetical protein
MPEKFELVQVDDVLSLEEEQDEETERLIEDILNTLEISALFRSDNFIDSLIEKTNFLDDAKPMVAEGIPCRMMTPRKQGWIKGKVKLSLQFIPDENDDSEISVPFDNPLDEIRKTSDATIPKTTN